MSTNQHNQENLKTIVHLVIIIKKPMGKTHLIQGSGLTAMSKNIKKWAEIFFGNFWTFVDTVI